MFSFHVFLRTLPNLQTVPNRSLRLIIREQNTDMSMVRLIFRSLGLYATWQVQYI